MGKARNPEELIADMEKVMSLCPGKRENVPTEFELEQVILDYEKEVLSKRK